MSFSRIREPLACNGGESCLPYLPLTVGGSEPNYNDAVSKHRWPNYIDQPPPLPFEDFYLEGLETGSCAFAFLKAPVLIRIWLWDIPLYCSKQLRRISEAGISVSKWILLTTGMKITWITSEMQLDHSSKSQKLNCLGMGHQNLSNKLPSYFFYKLKSEYKCCTASNYSEPQNRKVECEKSHEKDRI